MGGEGWRWGWGGVRVGGGGGGGEGKGVREKFHAKTTILVCTVLYSIGHLLLYRVEL